MKIRKIPFEKLSEAEKSEIKKNQLLGKVEVNCPWWPKNHWEDKINDYFFEECIYRIKNS